MECKTDSTAKTSCLPPKAEWLVAHTLPTIPSPEDKEGSFEMQAVSAGVISLVPNEVYLKPSWNENCKTVSLIR